MYQELITSIFEVVLIPLLGILTTYLVKWINAKAEELKTKEETNKYYKYISMLQDIIVQCVMKTQQTYVDSLKKQGDFGPEAQEKALMDTYHAVLAQLSYDAAEFLQVALGDMHGYIIAAIEKEVYDNKKE